MRTVAMFRALPFVFAFCLCVVTVPAQTTLFWRSEASNGNWNDANNWWNGSSTQTPAGSEILRFNNGVQLTMNNNLSGSPANRYRILFDSGSGARTISGSTANAFYDFGDAQPMIQNDSGNTQTINFPVANGNSTGVGALDIDAASGNLTFGGAMYATGGARTNFLKGSSNITVSGVISDGVSSTLGLNKSGTGTLTLSGNNTFTGGIVFNDGELGLNHNNAAGTGGITVGSGADTLTTTGVTISNALVLASGAKPRVQGSSTLTLSGVISGDGGLFRGATPGFGGTIVLNAANTFAGGVTTTNGYLQLGNKLSLGTGTLTVGEAGPALGSIVIYAQPVALTGANAVTNAIVINQDFFKISGSQDMEFSGPVTLNAFRNVQNVGNLTFSGLISGGFGMSHSGSAGSITTLSGTNTYTGNTLINSSMTVSINADENLGAGTHLTNFGTLRVTGSTPVTIGKQIFFYGYFDITNTAGVTFTNGLTGTGGIPAAFFKLGPGSLTLNGSLTNFVAFTHHRGELNIACPTMPASTRFSIASGYGFNAATNAVMNWSGSNLVNLINLASYSANNYTGTLNVSNGWLLINAPGIYYGLEVGQQGDGRVNVYAGNLVVSNSTPMNVGGLTTYGGVDGRGTLNVHGPGMVAVHGAATENILFGENNAAAIGTINFNGGTFATSRAFKKTTGAGHLNFNGGTLKALGNHANWLQTSTANIKTGGAFVDTGAFTVTNAMALLHDTNAPTDGGLTKLGAGKLSLLASNTFSGDTTVSSGTLALVNSGSLKSSSNLVVSSGATLDVSGVTGGSYGLVPGQTLKGGGTVTGAVAVVSGAIVSPGSSIGALTFNSPPSLSGTVYAEINRTNSPGADKIILTSGTLTNGGTLTVANVGEALVSGDTFDLFDATAFAGSFTTLNLPGTYLHWITSSLLTDGTITFTNNAPTLTNLALTRAVGIPYKIRKTNLAADADGEALTFSFSTTTNGATLTSDGTYIFVPGNTVTDAFQFSVTDGFLSATGSVVLTIVPASSVQTLSFTPGGGSVSVKFAGIPGYQYAIERATNVAFTLGFNSWLTNAPTNGLFQFTDNFSDLGVIPSEAYYRLRYQP